MTFPFQFAKHLPPPFDRYVSLFFLENRPEIVQYILINLVVLIIIAFINFRVFAKPPPVPLKKLPRRPALSILFKPDDITTGNNTTSDGLSFNDAASSASGRKEETLHRTISSFLKTSFGSTSALGTGEDQHHSSAGIGDFPASIDAPIDMASHASSAGPAINSPPRTRSSATSVQSDDDTAVEPPLQKSYDLPDSFAPLLSSSQTEMLLHHLTADLIHGFHAEASMKMRPGRHAVPLDKDPSRPQFTFEVPTGGVVLSAKAGVGSDGFSTHQDLDVTIPTTTRSRPMVKQAGLVFDPPLPLLNVAPTLIHIPTLFEDNTMVPRLRRMQLVRFMVDAVVALSSLIEKILWVIERYLQIHLSRVSILPIYRGVNSEDDIASPEWRLNLAFSGHCLLCGFIPIPFISVILPTFIIPQPHALLEYLLSKEPLASAKIRRENIAEQKIALALLDASETWNTKAELVATPPAVGIDLTLSGGVSLGLELMHGRDPSAGRNRQDGVGPGTVIGDASFFGSSPEHATRAAPRTSGASLSSWTTNENSASDFRSRLHRSASGMPSFDANNLVPWKLTFAAKGSMDKEKITFHLLDCSLLHEDPSSPIHTKSLLKTRGSLAVWKAAINVKRDPTTPLNKGYVPRRSSSFAHRAALSSTAESPSIASILLFPDRTESFQSQHRMLQYDYAFDISEDSQLDAITFSMGANHPMLNGGSMVTLILESMYAHGSVTARQDAVLDPNERRRKRNVLRHLPAIDFTFGIQNSFIPPESQSFTDDGQTRSLPEMDGGRVMVRFLGGIQEEDIVEDKIPTGLSIDEDLVEKVKTPVSDGIKVIADFGFNSIVLNSETTVKEFPELDIFEGTKLRAVLSGKIGGSVQCHLRPQRELADRSSAGPNIFNPLEAYEIDCSGSSLSFRIKESTTALGHRRIIIPTETTVKVKVLQSIVDMSMEGKSQCELSWDFQGLSPILQVTDVGLSPENVIHEKKEQVSLLIAPLRQGRLNFNVSPVGGITITKASTSREDEEGLFDWKFFNALVSPDQHSAERLMDVIHDKRTMNKLLQVIKLVNTDCHRVANYVLNQVWRAKEILEQEGVSDPKDIIPGHRMARLMSLLLCDDLSEVNVVLPLIRRVVAGDGLDVVTIKELLRKHCDFYDDWTPEIDRAVRWAETMFQPCTVPFPYVENHVTPLALQEQYAKRFKNIPSAALIYEQMHDRPHMPLDPKFSNLVGRVAPYLSFPQIEYFMRVRSPKDWQPSDLKRIRYVYSVKRKVLDIAESYGGLSFLPQSFLVSVFLGEATRASLRVSQYPNGRSKESETKRRLGVNYSNRPSTLLSLRQRRTRLRDANVGATIPEESGSGDGVTLTAAGRVASLSNFKAFEQNLGSGGRSTGKNTAQNMNIQKTEAVEQYELSDCLLGPPDVAILLQAGLTSVMKGSSVVQLNQRMLFDLIASQPKSFAIAVLAEIGTPGGQGSPRQLTSALMALLELDQDTFREVHKLDMHTLLESWLPGLKVPKREDYMAGGRWARQSYYDAIFSLSKSILEDATCYMALKSHLQRVRHHKEYESIPMPREGSKGDDLNDYGDSKHQTDTLAKAISDARRKIKEADELGQNIMNLVLSSKPGFKDSMKYSDAVQAYRAAFDACAKVRDIDKISFHSDWFARFYQRNYDALMIKCLYDNVIDNVDEVRYWLHCLRRGANFGAPRRNDQNDSEHSPNIIDHLIAHLQGGRADEVNVRADPDYMHGVDKIFLEPERHREQEIVEAIIDAIIYEKQGRDRLKNDPLVRLLIPNPPGKYDFTVVTAMGVITDGKAGTELQSAFERLEEKRGVKTIRSDTATARSLEYNASKIIDAIQTARERKVPYGLLGYSQGCANALMAETMLYSGTPQQYKSVCDNNGLVSRQLLFSAANASMHGPASDIKVQRLIVMVEEFFKYQQGYFSRALQSSFLEIITTGLDSPQFHKIMGGAQSFLADGCRAFWREAQHLAHVPTCTIRGVLEEHTTPEALEMLANMLKKQSGSGLHDSQVHVFDAVGYPVYHHNRNGKILEKCNVGEAMIQRTHHWSPLREEVDFISTPRDAQMASFECAKDRHVFPWVDVNARFGFIKYSKKDDNRVIFKNVER